LFWLFLGGFCWVIGDLFQQYAAKYIGIGRGIPLSNTNQLWGLAWGALVFGELAGLSPTGQALVIAGSVIMIIGAAAIGMGEAPASEQESWRLALQRECDRYGMDPKRVASVLRGDDPLSDETKGRRWWEGAVVVAAICVFIYLGMHAGKQDIAMNGGWMALLSAATLVFLVVCGVVLWKRTKFS